MKYVIKNTIVYLEIIMQYSMTDDLSPFVYKKYGFQMCTIIIMLVIGPHKTPCNPHSVPPTIETEILIPASVRGAQIS